MALFVLLVFLIRIVGMNVHEPDESSYYSARFFINPAKDLNQAYKTWLVSEVLRPFAVMMRVNYSADIDIEKFQHEHYNFAWDEEGDNEGTREQWHVEKGPRCLDFVRFLLRKYSNNGRGVQFLIEKHEKTLPKMRFLTAEFKNLLRAKTIAKELTYECVRNFDVEDWNL